MKQNLLCCNINYNDRVNLNECTNERRVVARKPRVRKENLTQKNRTLYGNQ